MPAFDSGAFDSGAFDELLSGGSLFLGADPFDALMNTSCSVLEDQSTEDSYGHKSAQMQDWTVILADHPCRISTGSGREFNQQKRAGLSESVIFMRPPELPGGNKLNRDHALKIGGSYYNITYVRNPSGMDHHYEVDSTLVIP